MTSHLFYLAILSIFVALAGTASASGAGAALAADAQSIARNPIIWADVPDVAAIRVGDTYYMSSTTMHMNPGLPIMKSKDLVNWQLVRYGYDSLGDDDATTLTNGKDMYSKGSWASSLRYHGGTFYVTTFSYTTGKTYVNKTSDIESGKWIKSSFSPALHDHSLFFDDDGRVYMTNSAGSIRLTELTPDASAIKPGGINQVIIPDAGKVAGPEVGLPAEGSQLRKINGKYYLFSITAARHDMRTQLVFRADQITGPYEGRVFLHDQGVAQGCLIDTPEGNWYAMLFQDNGAVGRTPFLVPVKWENGWPVAANNGKVPQTLNIPVPNAPIPAIVTSDDFDQPMLPLQWQWNHNPDHRYWSLSSRPGFMRLTTGRVDADLLTARNTLTQRTFGPECSAAVSLDVAKMKDGDVAGLAALQKRYGIVGVKMTGDTKSIVMISAESESPVELASLPLTQNTVFLKIDCDFKNRTDVAWFYYSLDGKAWTAIGKPLKMAYTIPHFMGYRFALFNYATKAAGGSADFDYFRISNQIAGPSGGPIVSSVKGDTPAGRPPEAAAALQPPFNWVSTGPILSAKSDSANPARAMAAIKDPTIVRYNDRWHIFATTATKAGDWGMLYTSFADWKDAAAAPQYYMGDSPNLRGYHCAPQVFYFRPQQKWYLIYQSQHPQFSTTTEIDKPQTWSKPQNFFAQQPKTVVQGWLDYWIICDDTHAYLFFTDDHGRFYRSRTALADFPNGFDDPVVVMHSPNASDLFEASCTYRIKGTGQYLTLVEAMGQGGHRYFRGFIADRLDGQWRPLADTWDNPFAGITHVRFEEGVKPWTQSISHGELLRDGYDETMTIDPANLALLYQGLPADSPRGLSYGQLPWQLGLLRRQ